MRIFKLHFKAQTFRGDNSQHVSPSALVLPVVRFPKGYPTCVCLFLCVYLYWRVGDIWIDWNPYLCRGHCGVSCHSVVHVHSTASIGLQPFNTTILGNQIEKTQLTFWAVFVCLFVIPWLILATNIHKYTVHNTQPLRNTLRRLQRPHQYYNVRAVIQKWLKKDLLPNKRNFHLLNFKDMLE